MAKTGIIRAGFKGNDDEGLWGSRRTPGIRFVLDIVKR